MGYTYSTFGDLKTALALRLSDPSSVFWTDSEKGIYLNAALREWNSIARMFRDRGSFSTTAVDTFYDLRSLLLNDTNEAFLDPIITDSQLLTQAKMMLMEPNPSNDTDFTDGFTLADFTQAFSQKRNQFLLETGLYISQPAPQVITAGTGRVTISDDSVIDVRRAQWNLSQLLREDGFTSSAFSPSWPSNSGTPQRYSIYPSPLLTLQLIPPPAADGTLSLQSISSGSIADDFTPALLWGVLADVLEGTGPNADPDRSAYADSRYKEGIIVGKQFATVLQVYIDDAPVATESVFDADTFQPSWTTRTTPHRIGLLGSNLAAVMPAADGIYTVTCDCVRNAPQMVAEGDYFPIGREYLDLFVDYAAHLATFKQGGSELQASLPSYDAFVKNAIAYNNRMSAQNLNFETMVDKAQSEEKEVALR